MKPWISRALQLLHDSLGTPRQEQGLIKAADPDSTSRKFAEYLPQWA